MDERKALFATNISMNMSQSAAARAAGMPASKSSELMRDPEVQHLIVQARKDIQDQMILSRNDVLQGMLDAIEDAKLQGEAMPQIAGWREIGKIIGCYAPEKKELVIEKNVEIIQSRIRELADEELHKYATIEGELVEDAQYEESA